MNLVGAINRFAVKWPLLGFTILYISLLSSRNSPCCRFSGEIRSIAKASASERHVDLSDSVVSVFGSDSVSNISSEDVLAIDRVAPLSDTLNSIMGKIINETSFQIRVHNKHILPIEDNHFNVTFLEMNGIDEFRKGVMYKNGVVLRLDSLERVGNTYISENTDDKIVLIQLLRLKIMKFKCDYVDEHFSKLGSSSYKVTRNTLRLNVTLNTNFDNSNCHLSDINLNFLHDNDDFSLKVTGLLGTKQFYNKLLYVLHIHFLQKMCTLITGSVLPVLKNVIREVNVCRYFDAYEHHETFESNNDVL